MSRNIFLMTLFVLTLTACGGSPTVTEPPPEIADQTPLPIQLTAATDPELLFEGSWLRDGVSLDIFLPPNGDFIFQYTENSSGDCGGGLLSASGMVELTEANSIKLTGTGSCENSNDEADFSLDLTYDAVENVLRDPAGNIFGRS